MKKIIILLLCFILCSSPLMAQTSYIGSQIKKQQEQKHNKIKGCGGDWAFRIASFATNPPFSWTEAETDNKGNLLFKAKGYNIDLIKEIASELNIKISVLAFPNDREAMAALHNGGVDMLVGLYYEPKLMLAHHQYIHPAYFQNIFTVAFLKGKEKQIKSFNDLIGLKGVVRTDENFYSYIFPILPKELDIKQVPDSKQAFSKLLNGEVDYIFSSPYSIEAEARRYKLNTDIKIMPISLINQELFAIFSSRSHCQNLYKILASRFQKKRDNIQSEQRTLRQYVDNWGQQFKDSSGLKEELKEEQKEKLKESAEPQSDSENITDKSGIQ